MTFFLYFIQYVYFYVKFEVVTVIYVYLCKDPQNICILYPFIILIQFIEIVIFLLRIFYLKVSSKITHTLYVTVMGSPFFHMEDCLHLKYFNMSSQVRPNTVLKSII